MRSLSNFLNDLPGIRPRKARALILEGDLLAKVDRADIRHRDSSWLDTVLEVGPDAAAAILAAYKKGNLPMKRGVAPTAAAEAEAYVAQGDELRKEIAERTRRERAIKDPSLVVESDLTDHRLVDSIFFENIGPGSGSMVLAGITVQKRVIGYKSNSGKSTGWRVRFDWVGSDGQRRHSETIPHAANNRRNDPERNWGLYE